MALIILLLFSVFFSFSAELYVSPSGSGTACTQQNPCSLSEALGRVGGNNEADTVYLMPGSYTPSSSLLISIADNKPLTIIGDNRTTTIIDGGYSISPILYIETSGSDNNVKITLKNIEIRKAASSAAYTLTLLTTQADVEMRNMEVRDNMGGGVYIGGPSGARTSGKVTIINTIVNVNNISASTSFSLGGGLHIKASSPVLLQNLTVGYNTAVEKGGGVYINIKDADLLIASSHFGSNKADDGPSNGLARGGGLYISGVYDASGHYIRILGSTFENNKADDGMALDILTTGTARPSLIMKGNAVRSNKSTHPSPSAGWRITHAITLSGGFKDIYILNNGIYSSDVATGISNVLAGGLRIGGTVEGVIDVGFNAFSSNEGQGLSIWQLYSPYPSSVRIYANRFRNNTEGLFLDHNSEIIVTGNAFYENTDHGMFVLSNGTLRIIDNLFYNNTNSSGTTRALRFYANDSNSSLTVTNNIFWSNDWDAEIYNTVSGTTVPVTLEYNDFSTGADPANPTAKPLYVDDTSTYTQSNNRSGSDPLLDLDTYGTPYGLQSGSPVIDAGTDTPYSLSFDIWGNKRPLDGNSDGTSLRDRGPFEYTPAGTIASLIFNPPSVSFGNVKLGTSSIIFLELINNGDFGLIGLDYYLSIIGFDKDQFSLLPLDYPPGAVPDVNSCYYPRAVFSFYWNYLPAGNSCYIPILFKPTSEGYKRADLTIDFIFKLTPSGPDVLYETLQVNLPLEGVATVPDIDVPASLEFTTPVGNPQTKTITVTNSGTADLVINTVSLSGSSTFTLSTDNCSGVTLAPAGTCTVSVRFAPYDNSVQTGRLTVHSDDPDENPIHVDLSGRGTLPDITVYPLELTYSIAVGSTQNGQISVTNEGEAPLIISSVNVTGSGFSRSSHDCGTLNPGDICYINVLFSVSSAGTYSGNVEIISNDPDEATVNVTLQGTAFTSQPDISADSTSLDFGTLWTGSSTLLTVVITNEGSFDLTINAVSISGDGFSITSNTCKSVTLLPNASCVINIQFMPTSEGTFNGTLTVASSDPDENPFNISLTGQGILPPLLEIQPDSIDFGTVQKGRESEKRITVKNAGSADLEINRVELNDTVFRIKSTNCDSRTLPKDQICNIVVVFKSDKGGNFSAVLSIHSNDPNASVKTVSLKGNVKVEAKIIRKNCSTGANFLHLIVALFIISLIRRR